MSTELLALDSEAKAHADALYRDAIVIDGLLPSTVYLRDPDYRNDLAESGITAGNFTVAHKHSFTEAVQLVQTVHRLMKENPRKRIVRSASDVREAKEGDETGVIIGFQGARPIGRQIDYLDAFYQMGVRILQLTYNSQNYLGTGCWEREDAGLTHFGRYAIDRMNELGMLIDLSHCNDRTTMEAIEYSDDPVAFTHVAVRSIGHSHGRGKTDEQMRAIADAGGLIGITFHPPFVKKDPDTHEVIPATIHDVLDHIDHVAELVGPEHVSFGSDMNNRSYDTETHLADFDERHMKLRAESAHVFSSSPPSDYVPVEGLHRTTKFENLAGGLLERGYSDDEISGILGGNFLRVFEQVVG